MDRLAVYPGDLTPSGWETAKLGHGLGLLPDAIQPRIRKTINGDWSLTLRYPLHGRGAELLRPDRLDHRVRTEAPGEFLDPGHALVTALLDDVGGAELAG